MSWSIVKALVSGNPHDVAADAQASYPGDCSGTSNDYWQDDHFVFGTVEFPVDEHPTAAQQKWLDEHPNILHQRLVQVDSWGHELD
jgi:hypothetical protein